VIRKTESLRGGQGLPRCLDVVSGFLFKLIRESVGLIQARLAEYLAVDIATIQGWESGRRSLTALRAADVVRLRTRLRRLGADAESLSALDQAFEADLIIADAVEAGNRPVDQTAHPLASSVHQRTLTNLITWPLTGIMPAQLRHLKRCEARRGPVPTHPVLLDEEKTRFFDHLLITVDAYPQEEAALLRRQAIYLLGFDHRAGSVDWLETEQCQALSRAARADQIPSWVAVRSSAMALTLCGNREPLRAFVRLALTDERQEAANLNYWAYWTGEIYAAQVDDEFMVTMDPRNWSGARPLGHLLERLQPGSGQTELNIHTVWALLLAHPHILENQPQLRARTQARIEQLDSDSELTPQARQELANIAYAVRLAQR
jgi:transcriptional regulator with XRE-family HTH domain